MSAVDVVVRNGLVSWRGWRASLFLSVLAPGMFLTAMGLGLGSLVEEGQTFGGIDYLSFFATGMLAANCMQNGFFGATYPIMSKITAAELRSDARVASLGQRDIPRRARMDRGRTRSGCDP